MAGRPSSSALLHTSARVVDAMMATDASASACRSRVVTGLNAGWKPAAVDVTVVGIVTMKYSNVKMNGRDSTYLNRLLDDVTEGGFLNCCPRSTSIFRGAGSKQVLSRLSKLCRRLLMP